LPRFANHRQFGGTGLERSVVRVYAPAGVDLPGGYMAMINCAECSSQVSDKAASCPKCGCPVPPPSQQSGTSRSDNYQAVLPPKTINAGSIIVALALVIGCGYALATMNLAPLYKIVAGGMVLGGLVVLGTNSMIQTGRIGYCKKCEMKVVARNGGRFASWRCERCDTAVKNV
jgi:hypothetical protein